MSSWLGSYREGLRGLDKRARVVFLASFLSVAARLALMTFLGIHFVREGVSVVMVGLAFLAENGGRALLAPVGGALSDRIGRAPVMIACILSAAITAPFLLLVRTGPQLILWGAIAGVTMGGLYPSASSLLMDVVPAERRQSVLSVNYTALSLGYTLGVAPAGFLAARSFSSLVVAATLTYLLLALLLFLGLRQAAPMGERPAHGMLREMARAPLDPRFLRLAALAFVFPLGIGLLSFAVPLYASDVGVADETIGLILGSTGVLLVLLAIPAAARLSRRPAVAWLPVAALLVAAAYAALAWSGSWWAVLAGVTIFTLGETIFSSAVPTAVAELAPPGSRGAYQGAWGTLFALAIGLALLVSGELVAWVGWRGAWIAFAAHALLAAVGLFALLSAAPRPPRSR